MKIPLLSEIGSPIGSDCLTGRDHANGRSIQEEFTNAASWRLPAGTTTHGVMSLSEHLSLARRLAMNLTLSCQTRSLSPDRALQGPSEDRSELVDYGIMIYEFDLVREALGWPFEPFEPAC